MNRPTRFYSNKQETQVAKTLEGKKTPNSGATSFVKGDVTTRQFLIECKTSMTNKQSMSIAKKWIDKLEEEAFAMGKRYSALVFDFGDGQQHYIINEKLFKVLKQYLENLENLED